MRRGVSGVRFRFQRCHSRMPKCPAACRLHCLRGIALPLMLLQDPVSDLAGAVLLIEEIDDPDETPGLLPSDRKQVLPSRVGRKVEFLQRLRISADKGLQHFFVAGG